MEVFPGSFSLYEWVKGEHVQLSRGTYNMWVDLPQLSRLESQGCHTSFLRSHSRALLSTKKGRPSNQSATLSQLEPDWGWLCSERWNWQWLQQTCSATSTTPPPAATPGTSTAPPPSATSLESDMAGPSTVTKHVSTVSQKSWCMNYQSWNWVIIFQNDSTHKNQISQSQSRFRYSFMQHHE